jgi:hypothetical protein
MGLTKKSIGKEPKTKRTQDSVYPPKIQNAQNYIAVTVLLTEYNKQVSRLVCLYLQTDTKKYFCKIFNLIVTGSAAGHMLL